MIVAGHNGSGKSTMWRRSLADRLEMPLVNADRMMLSILPEPNDDDHLVPGAAKTLRRRFPKTQKAIAAALKVADASILVDNSRTPEEAFTVCRVQIGPTALFDIRRAGPKPPPVISAWLDIVAPD